MSVVSLHPDDLLDRDARGTLSAAERAHLEQHLLGCAVCRMERATRDDFAAELAEVEEPRLSGAVLAALGSLAPTAPAAPLVGSHTVEAPPALVVARRKRFPIWLLAAAAVLVVGAAGAAGAVGVLGSFTPVPAPPGPPGTAAPVEAPSVIRLSRGNTADRPKALDAEVPPALTAEVIPPGASAVPTSVTASDPPPGPPPPGPPTPTTSRFGSSASHVEKPANPLAALPPAPTPPSSPAVAVTPPRDPAPPVVASRSPAAIFSEGNEARRRGEDDRAIALYSELERAHPDSAEARVARATLGRLLLERGQTSAALEKFDQYLERKGGALSEDVLVERAQSLQRLDRRAEERAAWQSLLRAYPRSAHAGRARERIEALDRR